MSTLRFEIREPRQAWGTERSIERPVTHQAPTRSGILGMLASALGRRRGDSMDDLDELDVAVRIDRRGILAEDYQTHDAGEEKPIVKRPSYLTDSGFTIAIAGDEAMLEELRQALLEPARSLYLGRSSCPIGSIAAEIVPGGADDALADGSRSPIHRTARPGERSAYRIRDGLGRQTPGWTSHLIRDVAITAS